MQRSTAVRATEKSHKTLQLTAILTISELRTTSFTSATAKKEGIN